MKTVLLLLGVLLVASLVTAQDYMDDEDDIDIEDADAYEEAESEPALNVPKEERPVYKPPTTKGAYFHDAFVSEENFKKRWVVSKARKDGADEDIAKYDGKWSVEEPADNPLQNDLGLVLKSRAKHHAVAAMLNKPFKFDGNPLVVQYEVRFQNGQECGGAYVKLLSESPKLELSKFFDKTPFTIMFGPDKCGNDDKLHFIFRHKNPITGEFEEKHAKKPTASLGTFFTDKRTHLYTLVVKPDNGFEVYVDQDLVNSGSLLSDVQPPVNPPATIPDPDDKKPEDWDEREKIKDPEAVKPEDWDESQPEYIEDASATKPDGWLDDESELIPDPDAERPEDWDEDMDGEWEAPMINNPACESAPGCGDWSPPQVKNPEYKGKWYAPMVDNPNYKGKWSPRIIDNPDYFEDKEPYKMTPIAAVGLELWSMSDDILFDNFLVTDSKEAADEWAAQSWELKIQQELAASGGKSVVQAVMDITNERPWLWAVILLVVVLPIVLLIAYCCSGSSKQAEEAAERKKTDAPSPDSEEKDDKQEEETADATETEQGAGDAATKKPSKSDLETEEDQGADAEDEEENGESTPKTRTSPRKRKTRKD